MQITLVSILVEDQDNALAFYTSVLGFQNNKERKTRRTYRELPPRTSIVMADLINSVLGSGALQLCDVERRDTARKVEERQKLADAIGVLK